MNSFDTLVVSGRMFEAACVSVKEFRQNVALAQSRHSFLSCVKGKERS